MKSKPNFKWSPKTVSAKSLPAFTARLAIESEQLGSVLGVKESIVDFGNGYGRLTPVLLKHAARVSTFERDIDMASAAAKYYGGEATVFTCARLADADQQDPGSYELALSFTVLQHMQDGDAQEVLDTMRRMAQRYVLLVEDTDPEYYKRDKDYADHISVGRSIDTYEQWMGDDWKLVHCEPRRVEPGYKGRSPATVGHYMLFERREIL